MVGYISWTDLTVSRAEVNDVILHPWAINKTCQLEAVFGSLKQTTTTCVDRMFARHQGAPRRRTKWSCVIIVEDCAGQRQGVDIGRGNLIGASETHIIKSLARYIGSINHKLIGF